MLVNESTRKNRCCRLPPKVWAGIAFFWFAVFFVSAFVVPQIITKALENGIRDAIVITGSEHDGFESFQYNAAKDTSPPLWKKYWIFNLTNPSEVLEHGAKPILVEKGPYSYRSHRKKLDIEFQRPETGSKQAMIEFTDYTYYIFHPEQSCPDCDPYTDVYTVPAPSFWTLYNKVRGDETLQGLLKSVLDGFPGQAPFVTEIVDKLLWGYEDPLLLYLKDILEQVGIPLDPYISLQTNHTSPEHAFNHSCRDALDNGHADITKIHTFDLWHCVKEVEGPWATPEPVFGTDATQTRWNLDCDCSEQEPPYQRMLDENGAITTRWDFHHSTTLPKSGWPCRGHVLPLWVDTVERTLPFQCYSDDAEIKGIKTYRYKGALSLLQNSTENPVNANYHQFGVPGLFNMSQMGPQAPLFLGKPHFLDADPSFIEMVEGVTPAVPEEHDLWLLVEPHTGATMQAKKRLQVNMHMNPSLLAPNLSESFCPIAWVEESSELTDKQAKDFKDQIYFALKLKKLALPLGLGLAGAVGIIAGAIWYIRRRRALKAQSEFDYYEYTTLYDGVYDDSINN